MHMVGLQVPFQDPTFLLTGQFVKYISKVLPELAIEYFSPAFRYPHHMELAIPFRVA
jgi:hypothetical protein